MGFLRLVPSSGAPIEIDTETVRVGRDEGCELVLADSSVSRRHALIKRHGEGWVIVDQNSANGTYLDGRPVSEAPLLHGQRLQIGTSTFKVELDSGPDGATVFLSPGQIEGPPPEATGAAGAAAAARGAGVWPILVVAGLVAVSSAATTVLLLLRERGRQSPSGAETAPPPPRATLVLTNEFNKPSEQVKQEAPAPAAGTSTAASPAIALAAAPARPAERKTDASPAAPVRAAKPAPAQAAATQPAPAVQATPQPAPRKAEAALPPLVMKPAEPAKAAPAPADPLAAAIGDIDRGDYKAALATLEAFSRRLESDPSRSAEAAQAHLYTGVALVGLGQEEAAKVRFSEALAKDGRIRLNPDRFAPASRGLVETASRALRAVWQESQARPGRR